MSSEINRSSHALLDLDHTTLDAAAVPLDAVPKARLHLLKLIKNKAKDGVDGRLLRPRAARVMVIVFKAIRRRKAPDPLFIF
jgi:hypothetical protein